MMHEKFRAVADVWAVPKPNSSKFYRRDWGHSLFSCLVTVDPDEGPASLLQIKLEDLKNHSLIAVAPYDGQHGVTSVVDSARHFVFVIRNANLEAWLGIGFRDRTDSIGFSLAIQTFMRRRMFENRLSSPGWSSCRTASLPARAEEHIAEGHDPNLHKGVVPLISPPSTDSASSSDLSDEDFGEFQ